MACECQHNIRKQYYRPVWTRRVPYSFVICCIIIVVFGLRYFHASDSNDKGFTSRMINKFNARRNMPTKYNFRISELMMLKRSRLIKEICSKYDKILLHQYAEKLQMEPTWETLNESLILNPDYLISRNRNLAWCKVPKVASTSFVYAFMKILGHGTLLETVPRGRLHTKLREIMPPPQHLEGLPLLHSFMAVRHPFDRILSAFRDKIENANEASQFLKFKKNYGQHIIENFRDKDSSNNKNVPTFLEFVKYLVSTPVWLYNEHWMPYYLICTPCHFRYKVIMHFEKLDNDIHYLIDLTGLQTMKVNHDHETKSKEDKKLVEVAYFSTIPKSLLIQLYQKYQIDFEMFGYSAYPYLTYCL